jgi:hypothetical protein
MPSGCAQTDVSPRYFSAHGLQCLALTEAALHEYGTPTHRGAATSRTGLQNGLPAARMLLTVCTHAGRRGQLAGRRHARVSLHFSLARLLHPGALSRSRRSRVSISTAAAQQHTTLPQQHHQRFTPRLDNRATTARWSSQSDHRATTVVLRVITAVAVVPVTQRRPTQRRPARLPSSPERQPPHQSATVAGSRPGAPLSPLDVSISPQTRLSSTTNHRRRIDENRQHIHYTHKSIAGNPARRANSLQATAAHGSSERVCQRQLHSRTGFERTPSPLRTLLCLRSTLLRALQRLRKMTMVLRVQRSAQLQRRPLPEYLLGCGGVRAGDCAHTHDRLFRGPTPSRSLHAQVLTLTAHLLTLTA